MWIVGAGDSSPPLAKARALRPQNRAPSRATTDPYVPAGYSTTSVNPVVEVVEPLVAVTTTL